MGLASVSSILGSTLGFNLNLLLQSFCLDFGILAFIKNTSNLCPFDFWS